MEQTTHGDPSDAARFVDGPVRTARVYEELAASMRARILSGELEDGHRLPSEKELADHAGVSRSTVREALRVLEQGGFVERLSPKVLVIRRGADRPAFQELSRALRWHRLAFNHLQEALLVLEPAVSALAAERADAGDVRELGEILAGQERNRDRLDTFVAFDERFHLQLAEMSGNAALVIARAPVSPLIAAVLQRALAVPDAAASLLAAQRRLFERVAAGESEEAAAAARARVATNFAAWQRSGLDVHSRIPGISHP